MTVAQLTQERERVVNLRNKRGDVVGGDHLFPKGDFSRFLGFKPETEQEKKGTFEGWRAVELAIQKDMSKLGQAAMKNGTAYRNMYVANGIFDNQPGRERDGLASGLDTVRASLEVGAETNMRYLEMQYRFQLAGINFGTISNLMKTRNDTIKKVVNEVK
jgi:hypothetical protein